MADETIFTKNNRNETISEGWTHTGYLVVSEFRYNATSGAITSGAVLATTGGFRYLPAFDKNGVSIGSIVLKTS